MGVLGRVLGRLVEAVVGDSTAGRVAESAGATVDADDDQWRPLSTDGTRDLVPVTQRRMQQLAVYAWERIGLARAIIELPIAYIAGRGCAFATSDKEATRLLDRHWRDGLNQWPIRLEQRVRELSLFGEQCWAVFRNSVSGAVRVGYIDPQIIDEVIADPDNAEQPIGVRLLPDAGGRKRTFRVIVNVPETAFGREARAMRAQMVDGECFFFRVNGLSAGRRGRSDILPVIDWLDAYEEFLFGELERADNARNFVWDVTLKGATADQVRERAQQIAPPLPNSVRVHNDAEEWQAVSPSINAYESAAGARMFRNAILATVSIPPTWVGDGEDANRASSQSMAEPTERMLERRQSVVGHMLCELGRYVLRSHWRVLDREPSDEQQAILDSVRIEWPALTAKDTTRYAAALQQLVNACLLAVDEGLITRETALSMIAAMAAELGVEIDAEAELERASQGAADRGAGVDPGLYQPARDEGAAGEMP